MTAACPKCQVVRNIERVPGPIGTNNWSCKICGSEISTREKSDD